MNDFPYKGEPAGLVLARLGLPQDTLIKIRRKLSPGILRQMSQSLEDNASLGVAPSSLYASGKLEGLGFGQQQQNGLGATSVSAIMDANQKTFKAECMYSYRIRAESLWGRKDDLTTCREEKGVSTGETDLDATANANRKSFSRKRWVSDTDAGNLFQRPAAGGTAKGDGPPATGSNAKANGAAVVGGSGGDGGGDGGGALAGVADGETYTDIFPVSAAEPVQAGDVLFLSCAQATMIDFQAVTVSQGLKGLKFLDVSALDLPGHGTEFFEIVLSGHNHFVGRSASRDNAEFAAYYNVSVVAVRRRGQATATNPASVIAAPLSSARPSVANTTGSFKSRPAMMDAPEVFLEEGVEPALNPDSRVVSPSGSASTPQSRVTAASFLTGSRGRAPMMPRSPMIRLSRKNTNVTTQGGDDEKDVTESSFKAGDVVLVLAKEEFMEKYGSSRDFFLLTKVGSVPKPVRYYDYLPLLAFLGMLIWVLFDVEMVSSDSRAAAPRGLFFRCCL